MAKKLIMPTSPLYPTSVCKECGEKAAKLAGTKVLSVSTWYSGRCGVCGRLFQSVTEPRDFGYPPFEISDDTVPEPHTTITEPIEDNKTTLGNGDTPHMENALIFCDIDGVLADSSHRLPYLEKKEYDKFYGANMADDSKTGMAALAVGAFISGIAQKYGNGEVRLRLLTGRPKRTRTLSWLWLRENYPSLFLEFVDLDKEHVLCRGDNDWRPAPQVKMDNAISEIVFTELGFAQDMDVFLLDDDPEVVKYFHDRFSERVGEEVIAMNEASVSCQAILIDAGRLKSCEPNKSSEE